jgi:asparagine synthase (glutamine-hydrolysing)
MCGFSGFAGDRTANASDGESLLRCMGDSLAHRGPDDSGVWMDADAGIGLAHRRLSIVDLSPAGHQPMVSPSGRFVFVFNGEIYNHLELRKELADVTPSPRPCSPGSTGSTKWRGHSDTETLLAGFEAWGFEATLQKAVGMFAFALWDRGERVLYLARDRMGEKPLYYGWQNGVFLFGSELKALKKHPSFQGEIDRDALTLLLRHNYIPAPYSIYKSIRKLPPGTFLRLAGDGRKAGAGGLPDPAPYWSLARTVGTGREEPLRGSEAEAVSALEARLKESIGLQMMADVPLGAFLSGGVDSSTVVALMQAQSSRPVKTFTIGFGEEGYNEAEQAKAVARHLGTDHTELYVTADEARNVIPRLPTLYDEPFSDSSQIPTFLVSHMARQHVTVALSGDGGDELFGGYDRYFQLGRIWRYVRKLPPGMRNAIASAIQTLPRDAWNRLYSPISKVLPQHSRSVQLGYKAYRLAEILECKDAKEIYYGLLSQWKDPAQVVIGASEPLTSLTDRRESNAILDIEQYMMYVDAVSYLPDDILVKVDRAAMGVSLETRVPFLDHRVVEFAWRLPLSMKIRNGQGKWILRQVLDRHVPKALIDRPKMGFGVPIDSWLRGPLRNWAEGLLNEGRLRREGFFNPGPIREKWSQHLAGQRNWQYHLWNVLMFQAWLENERAQ